MESDISQAFQEELTCFICLSCLTEPVTISCGHCFCRACLQLSWEDNHLPVHCPMCREPCQQKEMRTNIVLKKLVPIFFDNVTTSHSNMNLFNVLREFSLGPHLKDTSVDSVGCYLACWGSLRFNSGKYYWEVDLQDSGDWAVGVCEDSWLRNTNQMIDSEGAFLLVCMKEGNHYSLLTTCPLYWHYVEKPLGRVGVLLDCERGCLSFVNVPKSSVIYRYPPWHLQKPCPAFLLQWP
nr:tripartite motif-containing protein 43B-like [Peromyscus maniculatus bairdii]